MQKKAKIVHVENIIFTWLETNKTSMRLKLVGTTYKNQISQATIAVLTKLCLTTNLKQTKINVVII